MPTYEIYFKGNSEFVDCESMEDALREARRMIDDPDMDWVQRENGEISYYDYFVDVIIERYFDDDDDNDEDEDDAKNDEEEEEEKIRIELVHETEAPDECPYCGADDWEQPETPYMHGNTYWYTETCRECGAEKTKTSYGKYTKEVNGVWISREVRFQR